MFLFIIHHYRTYRYVQSCVQSKHGPSNTWHMYDIVHNTHRSTRPSFRQCRMTIISSRTVIWCHLDRRSVGDSALLRRTQMCHRRRWSTVLVTNTEPHVCLDIGLSGRESFGSRDVSGWPVVGSPGSLAGLWGHWWWTNHKFNDRCRVAAVSYTHLTLPTKRIV